MPIRHRFLLIISCSFLGLILFQKYFVIPRMQSGFYEVETQHAKSAHERLDRLFQSKVEYVEAKIYDWAVWDDTYEFILGKNPNYLQKHIPDPEVFFKALQINYAIAFDLEGSAKLILNNDQSGTPYPHTLSEEWISQVWSEVRDQAEQVKSGVVQINGIPVLYASTKIRKGDGKGAHPGYFVAIEKLDSEFEKELSAAAASTIEIATTSSEGLIPANYEFKNADTLMINLVLKTSSGGPIAIISQKLSRAVNQTASRTARELEIFMVSVLGLTFLGMLILIRTQVISPILNFSDWLRSVAKTGDWRTNRYSRRFGGLNVGTFKIRHEVDQLVESSSILIDKIEESNSVIHKQTMMLVNSDKIRSLGEMSGGVAHEINNPLTIILTQVEIFKRELQKETFDKQRLQDLINKIETTSLRIKKIVTGLLKFSRDGERDPLVASSLAQSVAEAIDLFGEKLKSNKIELIRELDNEVMANIRSTQISQVVMNLIGNSIDAIQNLEKKWIKIRVFSVDDRAVIQITDSGSGIPVEHRDKVLQPFFTTKMAGQGTGLGLSISLGLVEAHNGKLFIDHQTPNTTFVIELPLAGSYQARPDHIRRAG